MKILLLPSYFFPEGVASPYISQNRNQRFADEGWDMVVYTPTPSRGITPEMRKEYLKKEHRIETALNEHLVVHRFRLVEEGKNPIIRAFRYFAQNIKQFNHAVFGKDARKCNVMLIASTPPTQGAMAAMVKKFRHIPLVYNLQDIFPDSLVSTGMTHEGSLLWKIGRRVENFTYRNADKIIVISQDFKRNIMAKGVPEEKIEVIYNWVDQNAVVEIPREQNKLFDMYGLDRSKFYITYNGNIGLTQNMEMLAEVAREFEQEGRDDIHFVLTGNGAYWDTLVAKLRGMREERRVKAPDGTEAITFGNITLLPFQPYEDIAHVFSLGDTSLVISKPGVGENSVPSKTWSIMSASRPVLANFDENELKEIVDGTSASSTTGKPCGIFTKAGDKTAFKEAILKLYGDRELCKEMGRNGRQFVMDNLTKEVGTQKYVDVIKSVVSRTEKN
ncbi:MAG: glycosyltransferase family 4 protein [Bacteroidales bacterium]|nr:glycosyltransferase family 4 protein [Bacteroidales bacterium]